MASFRSPAPSPAGRGISGVASVPLATRALRLKRCANSGLAPKQTGLLLGAGMNQLQRIRLKNALNLVARVHGPGTGRIEPGVSLPVLQRLARLADFFI